MGSEESPDAYGIDAPLESDVQWTRGALGGFVAALVTAGIMLAVDPAVLQEEIAGLYLQEGVVAGAVLHLLHGTLFGVLFAVIVSDPSLFGLEDEFGHSLLAGVVYGLALGVFGAGFIMPIWLNVVDPSGAPPVPYVSAPLIGWHLVYGLVLGAVYELPDSL